MADNNWMMRGLLTSVRRKVSSLCATKHTSESIELTDLLGRAPVNLDTPELQRFIGSKRILITGAGGSIGSEIARQAAKFCPSQLILLDRFENALFEIDREIRGAFLGLDLVPTVADICDATRIRQIFAEYRPHVVFHAAAHKHVPMMEMNPGEAVKNNVFGTRIVADAAQEAACNAFVLISTDKAVNPTSVMGATKRCAELYIVGLNQRETRSADRIWPARASLNNGHPSVEKGDRSPGTRFVAVRFGNVLGSNGSVVPIFKKQIAAGGPVTVTHPDMRRYFMTIPEASQLVMQAGAMAQGGEIFVLDMGEPVRIVHLAEELIRRSGHRPHRDISIEFTGIRPGEKLFEELACDNEETRATGHEKIRVWHLPLSSRGEGAQMLEGLGGVVNKPRVDVIDALMSFIPEYTSEAAKPRLKLATDRVKDAA